MIRENHFFPSFHSLGGVEAMLNRHYQLDASLGFDSHFLIYHENSTTCPDRVHPLGFHPQMTFAEAQRRVRAAVTEHPAELAVYHGLLGVPWLAPLDQSRRRILVLHGSFPGIGQWLARCGRWFDGICGVSGEVLNITRQTLPALSQDRTIYLPYSIRPPELPRRPDPAPGRPIVIGFCSRLIVEQKRVDRLPGFISELEKTGIPYRFEFLGDGPDRPWLQGQFPDRDKFVFHRRQSGLEYWKTLASWDFIFSCSDYEGTPISLLEALAVGVAPIFPAIGCGGDRYVAEVNPAALYPPGDMTAAAQVFRTLARAGQAARAEWSQRAALAVREHVGEAYFERFSRFAREILTRERAASDVFPWRGFPLNRLTFAGGARLDGWKNRLRALRVQPIRPR